MKIKSINSFINEEYIDAEGNHLYDVINVTDETAEVIIYNAGKKFNLKYILDIDPQHEPEEPASIDYPGYSASVEIIILSGKKTLVDANGFPFSPNTRITEEEINMLINIPKLMAEITADYEIYIEEQ